MTSIIKVDTIQTSAGATPTASSLGIGGTGKVLQVVTGTATTSVSTTSTSHTDTGLSATITPSSASSKILIIAHCNMKVGRTNAETYLGLGIKRDSTVVWEQTNTGFGGYIGGASEYQAMSLQTVTYEDSPSSTSAITYKLTYRDYGAGTATANYGSTPAKMILMEIGA